MVVVFEVECPLGDDIMDEYHFDRLSPEHTLAIFGHLQCCPECRARFEANESLISALRRKLPADGNAT